MLPLALVATRRKDHSRQDGIGEGIPSVRRILAVDGREFLERGFRSRHILAERGDGPRRGL